MSRDTDTITVQAYSDVALKGAIASLERKSWLDQWGENRLRALKAEQERRTGKRREDGKVVSDG